MGFPHYAHLLGRGIAKAALELKIPSIDIRAFNGIACEYAVANAEESLRQALETATQTNRRRHYQKVLCGCANVRPEREGGFEAADVSNNIFELFGENIETKQLYPILRSFTQEKRASVLTKFKSGTKMLYQFSNPLMRPFLRIRSRSMRPQ